MGKLLLEKAYNKLSAPTLGLMEAAVVDVQALNRGAGEANESEQLLPSMFGWVV